MLQPGSTFDAHARTHILGRLLRESFTDEIPPFDTTGTYCCRLPRKHTLGRLLRESFTDKIPPFDTTGTYCCRLP